MKKKSMAISEARKVLEKKEKQQLFDQESVVKLAIQSAEQDGIVFIDEIDISRLICCERQ